MKRLVLLCAAFAAFLTLAVPVASAEGPPFTASGSFAESFVPSNFRTAGAATFFDFAGSETLTGTFSGIAVFEGSAVIRPGGQIVGMARETFTGTVAGRPGTPGWVPPGPTDFAPG